MILDLKYLFVSLQALLWNWLNRKQRKLTSVATLYHWASFSDCDFTNRSDIYANIFLFQEFNKMSL